MSNECQELKNINYQTMLLNNNTITNKKPNIDNISEILSKNNENSGKKPWNKLGKSVKLKKLIEYHEKYSEDNSLSSKEKSTLRKYLLTCLERKQIQRTKDVVYDQYEGRIINIPALIYNKNLKKFTLKRSDKKSSTLKSLAPKRKKKKSNSKDKNKDKVK